MGPPSLNGGNIPPASPTGSVRTASMGPPSLNGGNNDLTPRLAAQFVRLQWGRRLSTAETLIQQVARGDKTVASMGPPSLNGGNPDPTGRPGRQDRRFNGAAVSQRRKPAARAYRFLTRMVLQWGRRLSTAETHVLARRLSSSRKASMGPPSLNGGNRGVAAEGIGAEGLQWGRRLSTAETSPPKARRIATFQLQWGRRLSTAETRYSRPYPSAVSRGFNGAAVSQRRKRAPVEAVAPDEHLASMGPPSLNGGNLRPEEPPAEGEPASMGPPSLNGGNLRPEEPPAEGEPASMGPPSLNGGNV